MSGMQHRRECHTRTIVMKALYWMSARAAGDPADSLRRRDDRGSGRRERLNTRATWSYMPGVTKDIGVQHPPVYVR
jgi:hypothetical protein